MVVVVDTRSAPPRPLTVRTGRPAAVVTLSWLVAALAVPAAATGLFWRDGRGPVPVSTVRGETVELYGRGLYRYDTLFAAGGAHGNDAVVLLLGVPLLVLSTLAYRRAARWRAVHTGVLGCLLYIYASAALGTVAFNPTFPLYVALFSASLFATVLSFSTVDTATPPPAGVPRRGLAAFLYASGAVTMLVWGLPLAAALARGGVTDRLDSYTTEVTFALDLGVVAPLVFLAATLVAGGRAWGYALAVPLLVLEVMLLPLIVAGTVGQLDAGVSFPPGEVVGPIAGFLALALGAGWYLVAVLRRTGVRP